MQYVYARIEKALTENAEYMQLQSDHVTAQKSKDDASYVDIADQMEAKAEELCYIKGYRDAMAILTNN